jgi:hypothetical protein
LSLGFGFPLNPVGLEVYKLHLPDPFDTWSPLRHWQEIGMWEKEEAMLMASAQ